MHTNILVTKPLKTGFRYAKAPFKTCFPENAYNILVTKPLKTGFRYAKAPFKTCFPVNAYKYFSHEAAQDRFPLCQGSV